MFGGVALMWRRAHWGEAWQGYDGGLLVADVVRYWIWQERRHCWWAFVRLERVPGEWATAEAAMAAVDSVAVVRFLVDRHVYDHLIETPERQRRVAALHTSGALELLVTHVQIDEIVANRKTMTDPATGDAIPVRDVMVGIPFTPVETYGMVLGDPESRRGFKGSKVGLARFGELDQIDTIRSESGGHTADALLATTARYEGAILVTDDRRLCTRAPTIGVDVWSSDRFLEHVDTLAAAD